jgi:hypothetical protein
LVGGLSNTQVVDNPSRDIRNGISIIQLRSITRRTLRHESLVDTLLLSLAKGKGPVFEIGRSPLGDVLLAPILDPCGLLPDKFDLGLGIQPAVAVSGPLVMLSAEKDPDMVGDQQRAGFVSAKEVRDGLSGAGSGLAAGSTVTEPGAIL